MAMDNKEQLEISDNIIENEVRNILATEEIREFLKNLPVSALNKINSVMAHDAQLGREYLKRFISHVQRRNGYGDETDSSDSDPVMKALWRKKRRQKKAIWETQKQSRSLKSYFRTTPAPSGSAPPTLPSVLLENFEVFQIPSDVFLQNFKTTPPTSTTEKPTLQKYLSFDQFLSSTQSKPSSSFWPTTALTPNRYGYISNSDSGSFESNPGMKFSSIGTASKVDKSSNPSFDNPMSMAHPPRQSHPQPHIPTSNILVKWSKPDTPDNHHQVLQSVPGSEAGNTQQWQEWSWLNANSNHYQNITGTEANKVQQEQEPFPNVQYTPKNQNSHHVGIFNQQHNNPSTSTSTFTSTLSGFLNQNKDHHHQNQNKLHSTSHSPHVPINNNNNNNVMNQINQQVRNQPSQDSNNFNFQNFQQQIQQNGPGPGAEHSQQQHQQNFQFSKSPIQNMPPHHQQPIQVPQYYPSQDTNNNNYNTNNNNNFNNNNNDQNGYQLNAFSDAYGPSYKSEHPGPAPSFYAPPGPGQIPHNGWPAYEQHYSGHENPAFNSYSNNPYHPQQPYDFQHYNPYQLQQQYGNYPPYPPSKYQDEKEDSDEDDKKGKKSDKSWLHKLHKSVFGDKHKGKKKGRDKGKDANYGWPGSGWSGGPGSGSGPGPGWSWYNNEPNNNKDKHNKNKGKGSNENDDESNDAEASFSDTYDKYSKKASDFWDKIKYKVEDHFEKKAHDKHSKMKKKKSYYSVTQKIYGISISVLSLVAFFAYILALIFQSAVTYLTFPLLNGIIGLVSGDGGAGLVEFFVGRSLNSNYYYYNDWWQNRDTDTGSANNDIMASLMNWILKIKDIL